MTYEGQHVLAFVPFHGEPIEFGISPTIAYESPMAHHLIIGCGYLGSVVARQWLHQGHTVSALTRSRTEYLQTQGLTPIVGDVLDGKIALPQADKVLYAVGMDRRTGRSMREVYLGGLENVLRSLPTPRRLIYISSTSVYGQTGGEWVDETSPTEPHEESGQIILACEQMLQRHVPQAIILRFAGIYGPERVIRRAAIEQGQAIVTDPDHWLNLIHVADGSQAVVDVATRGQEGTTYNVSDGHPVTRREFYTTMAEMLRAPGPTFQEPTAETRSSHDVNHRRIANQRLLTELGTVLAYPTFREGLQQAISVVA